MADSDSALPLKLAITAKDEASTALGKVHDRIASAVQSALAFAGAALGLQKAVQAAGDFEEQLSKSVNQNHRVEGCHGQYSYPWMRFSLQKPISRAPSRACWLQFQLPFFDRDAGSA